MSEKCMCDEGEAPGVRRSRNGEVWQASSTSAHPYGSRAGHFSNGSCVSKLPVIAHRAHMQELAVSGKTQWRAPAITAQLRKELPLCHKPKLVKNSACNPSNAFRTPRRMQSSKPRVAPNQEIQKENPKTTPSLRLQALSPIPEGQDAIRHLDSSSVPLPFPSLLMSSLHYRSPSPVDELDLQLISHPFQEYLNESSIDEDIGFSESSGSRIPCGTDVSESTGDSGISSSRYPLNNGGTPENSLSDHFRSMDLLTSQYNGEDDPLHTRVNPRSWGETSPPSCSLLCSTRTPVYLEPPVRLGTRFLGERDGGGYNPVLPIAEAGPVSSLTTVAERPQGDRLLAPTAREHLDQLISDSNVSPTRAGWPSLDGDRSEERGERRGEQNGTSISSDLVALTSLGTRVSGLLDHLDLVLMALQEVRRDLIQLDRAQEGRGGASLETHPQADPETLCKITESLLNEESDEEEGDLCRICQSWGGSPQNPLLSPCQCSGSLQYVHHDCLKRWIQAKIQSGAELTVVKTCELCKASLNLDLEGFNLEECYRQHQTQVEQANPEIHVLRLLLHLSLLDMMHAEW